jgi:hypothetical protein
MDLSKVLSDLRAELANLDAAILSLERLQQEGRRRGRPPKALAELTKASRAARKDGAEPDAPSAEEG